MKQAARWVAILALFAIPFLPLYVSNNLFFPFITGKALGFRILVEVALAGYLVLAVLDRRYRPRFSWPLVLFTAFVGWMAVADAFGVLPLKAFWSNFERMDGWVTLIHLLAFFVVAGSVLAVDKLWRAWWLTFLSVAALVCGYGLLQVAGGVEIHQGGVRVDATFGNAIYMAVYLMFAIAITLWQAIESRGGLRYALGALAVVELLLIFYTASRGAVIGLAGGAVVSALLWLWVAHREKGGKRARRGMRIAVGALVAVVLATGSLYLARDSAFVEREPSLARLVSVFSLESELKVRFTIWNMALEGALEDPITGWGQEGFNQVFNKHYDPSLFTQESWFDRAHNNYLDWLVAGGVPALLLFVAFLISLFVALYRDPNASRAQRVILVGAVAAYAIQALVAFDNLFSYVPLIALAALAHGSVSRPMKTLEGLPEPKSETTEAIIAAATVAIAAVVVWSVNAPVIRAGHHLVYAVSPLPGGPAQNLEYYAKALSDGSPMMQEIREQLVSSAAQFASRPEVAEALRMEAATLAISEMGKEVEYSPNDARLRVQYALAYDTLGDYEHALAEIETALALSPKKQQLLLKKASELMDLKRPDEARAALDAAYALDPSFPDVAIAAAAAQIEGGDVAGGKKRLIEAIGTTTPDSDSLFYAYYIAGQYTDLVSVAQARVSATNGEAEARYRLAQAYYVAGSFDRARQEIIATISAHPETRQKGETLLSQMFAPAR